MKLKWPGGQCLAIFIVCF